jgi:hypothetical protein
LTADAARQSVTVGIRNAHPIRKKVGTTACAMGHDLGRNIAESQLKRHASTTWSAQ